MFEVEVSGIEPFRNLMRALAAVVEEGCFDIYGEKIKLLASRRVERGGCP